MNAHSCLQMLCRGQLDPTHFGSRIRAVLPAVTGSGPHYVCVSVTRPEHIDHVWAHSLWLAETDPAGIQSVKRKALPGAGQLRDHACMHKTETQ